MARSLLGRLVLHNLPAPNHLYPFSAQKPGLLGADRQWVGHLFVLYSVDPALIPSIWYGPPITARSNS